MRKYVDTTGGWDELPSVWRATDLKQAQQARWLAKGRLPRAAVTILIGDEGIGKSLLWVHIAAAVTTGRALPEFGIPERDQANVLIVVTEDDWSTTVLPRLMVAGADLGFVHVICAESDGSGSPTFPNDIQLVQNADPAPALVVVDAWLDTVPTNLSVKDPQGARQALHPWKDVATKTDAAILLLTHTNRSTTGNARDKYGATSELRKKARMTLFAQRDESEYLTVGPEKSNTTGKLPATMFKIDPVQHFDPTDDHDGTVPMLVFVGESDRTAGEILTSMTDVTSGDGHAGDVEGWLLSFLGDNEDGRQKANDVYTAADAVGYSKDMAKRAKAKLGIDAVKDGSSWFWQLPQQGSAQAREQRKGGMSEGRSLTPFQVRDSFGCAPLNDDEGKGAREHDSDTPPSRPLGVWLGSGEPVVSR
ncbi:AAA family ATPase [Rhodococcus tibetensis]|uniref:AAA family ATPase n=1 Tax=Rhodococcus tibetensis TaxID=2965064 RepID=A0ABT1Q8X8_9NOCA|nr:AAA family ATPase [Rhodococcus sp. FXJ9.536]MCQ4118712.1 AAA family ATPase [Rhodococcus sp. FXJ9.536]